MILKCLRNSTIILLIILLIACSGDEPLTKRQRLLQSIAEIEKGFEARVVSEVVEYVSKTYQDHNNRGYDDIRKAVQIQMIRHKSLYVFSSIKDIVWHGDKQATVEIAAAMGAKPMESSSILTSVRADMVKFTVDFVLEEGVYMVKSAKWEWADPSDFL